MRNTVAIIILAASVSFGCPAAGNPTGPANPTATPGPETTGEGQVSSTPAEPAGTAPAIVDEQQIPPERRVWAFIDGQRRAMDIDQARSVGLTIVDLSDDWVPYIFWSKSPGEEDYKPNAYAETYVRLANDEINLDGAELKSWDRNYLEVYGIPPTLSVLRRRVLADEQSACFKNLDYEFFKDYRGPVRAIDARGSAQIHKAFAKARAAYRKALRAARVRTLEALLAKPAYSKIAQDYQRAQWRSLAISKMQARVACEKMYGPRTPSRISRGTISYLVRRALRRFERKHNVYGRGMIGRETAAALGRTPLENNFESLKRLITERVISAAGILEDGTVRRGTYLASDRQQHEVRNLAQEFTDAVLNHMGLTDAERAAAFLKSHEEADFNRLWIAVPLPSVPEYYGDQMDLSVIIDRGDVWYDLPFNDKGKRVGQPRRKLPLFTLFVTYNGQKIPLVHWRTTIGGWAGEKHDGQDYFKYKISDVGKRVWKNIVAGPVWVPPPKTPSVDLVKIRSVRGASERVVGQSTTGPGYASAYGLVAAFHIRESDGFDNQIRTHGTVNYMSILGSFSHGCHRLFNYRAVRLFSFVLRHRKFKRRGQTRLAFKHRYEHRGEEFQLNLHTRGYYYTLTPPVPVDVLEGRIRGKLKEPVEEYVKKPGRIYQEDLPDSGGTKHNGTMTQRQSL